LAIDKEPISWLLCISRLSLYDGALSIGKYVRSYVVVRYAVKEEIGNEKTNITDGNLKPLFGYSRT
jgi:hypothetical protein